MPNIIRSIPCVQPIIDKITNTITYISVIEQFGFEKLGITAPNFFICTMWKREEEEEAILVRVLVHSPSGEKLATIKYGKPLELGKYERYRLNQVVGGFRIEDEGDHTFTIETRPTKTGGRWKKVDSFELPVKVVSRPETYTITPAD